MIELIFKLYFTTTEDSRVRVVACADRATLCGGGGCQVKQSHQDLLARVVVAVVSEQAYRSSLQVAYTSSLDKTAAAFAAAFAASFSFTDSFASTRLLLLLLHFCIFHVK